MYLIQLLWNIHTNKIKFTVSVYKYLLNRYSYTSEVSNFDKNNSTDIDNIFTSHTSKKLSYTNKMGPKYKTIQ